ncbi:MAG TPA: sigma-70 family RNA polymerase sigma factor [Methylomirabilota bacterium]|nr:sigma-70 family RNA polymerase sigma factor [Methylomirabilota bacterium]
MESVWMSLSDQLPGIRRYARRISRDQADADDLVQECLTRALSRRHVWGEVRDVRAYLFAMLRHTHVDLAFRNRADVVMSSLEEVAIDLPCGPTQQQALLLRDLGRSLAALSSERRLVLLLVGLEGMSYREVADAIGVPIGTVMSRLARARDTLRQLMLDGDPCICPSEGRMAS